MPDGVEKIEIWHNQELVFFLNDGTQIPLKSRVNITTNNLCTEQTERCHYNFNKTIFSQGLKHITIEAKGDYVIISGGDEEPAAGPLVCIDLDGDGYGVCPNCNITTGCKFDGHDCDDNNILIYPGATEICNGIDDDCNPGTADGSGEAVPLNSKQAGVCEGSTKSCSGVGGWVDEYAGIINYEDPEVTCYDGLNNDCDAWIDCDDEVDCEDKICDEAGTMMCIYSAYTFALECTLI